MDVTGVVGKLFSQIGEVLSKILNFFIGMLPDSPFTMLDNSVIKEYLGYINWIVPFDFAILIFSIWLPALAAYYLISVALRWIKVVE